MGRCTGLGQPAGDFWQPEPEDRSVRSRPLARRFRTDLVKRSLIPAAFVLAVGSSVIVAPPTTAHPAASNGQSDSHTTTFSQSRLALSSSSNTSNSTSNSNSSDANASSSSSQSSFTDGIQVTKYTTKQGQTLDGVSEATGRSVQTLLWANEIQDTDAVFDAGVTLVVPPVDGVLYTVRPGDTLASIAQYFQVSVDAITGFAGNQVSSTSNLSAGQLLILPGATGLNRTKVISYTVSVGDSVRSIAGRFGLQTNTIFWANRSLLTNPDKIMPGDQLTILPTDGVYVTVQPGQSIYGLAEIWGVAPTAITGYAPNGISMNSTILPGDNLIIPGADITWPPPQPKPVVTQSTASTSTSTTTTSADTETGAGAGTANTAKAGSTTDSSSASTTGSSTASKPAGSQTAQFAQESAPTPVPTPEQAPDNKQATTSTTQTSPAQEPTQAPAETPTAPPPPPPTPTPTPPPPAPTPTPVPPQPTPTPQPVVHQQSTGFIWPLQGTVTQGFGPTSFGAEPAYDGYAHFHTGLDIAAPQGTPIHAAAAGTVTAAGWNNYGYGYMVEIDHGNGLVTLYGHMMQQPSVSVGQQVSQGETIGYVGTTGNSTGDHCHFGVELNGTWVNPYNYLP